MDELEESRGRKNEKAELAEYRALADQARGAEIAMLLREACREHTEKAPRQYSMLRKSWISDADALKEEHAFRKRFGIGFQWSDADRAALFELKYRLKMTDDHVRFFERTGTLKRTAAGFKLGSRLSDAVMGSIELSYLAFVFCAVLIAILPQSMSSLNLGSKAAGLAACMAVLCYAIYWASIKPWLLKRSLERAS